MTPEEKANTRIVTQDRYNQANRDFLTIYPRVSGEQWQALRDLQNILNIDESKDLDLIGRHVGVSREHERTPLSARSIGNIKARCGNSYAMCKAATWEQAKDLSDEIYRLVLKSKVVKNTSDATIMDVEEGVLSFITSTNVHVIDNQDMTFSLIFIGQISDVERYVIDNYDLIPRPQGAEFLGFTQTALSPRIGKSFAVCGNKLARCAEVFTI